MLQAARVRAAVLNAPQVSVRPGPTAQRGVQMLLDEAWADGRWGAIYAFPSVANDASNAICRTLGFRLVDTKDFEYQGRTLTCNHWRIDPPEGRPSA